MMDVRKNGSLGDGCAGHWAGYSAQWHWHIALYLLSCILVIWCFLLYLSMHVWCHSVEDLDLRGERG